MKGWELLWVQLEVYNKENVVYNTNSIQKGRKPMEKKEINIQIHVSSHVKLVCM
jgi:hypothetical protein